MTEGLLLVGGLMVVALAVDQVARRTSMPRVSLLLLVGLVAGPLALDLLPPEDGTWFTVTSRIALAMVGLLIGSSFTVRHVRELGREVAWITVVQGVVTAAVVAGVLYVVGVGLPIALLLGGIATATDPAATRTAVEESDADGPMPDRLLGVVAIDDVMGIIAFSVLAAVAGIVAGGNGAVDDLLRGAWEIGGAVLLGVALGVPGSYLAVRLRDAGPSLEEAIALVFLTTGLSAVLGVSFLLASVTLGAVVSNMASPHVPTIESVERIHWPFLIVFFVLAGASVRGEDLAVVGWAVLAYTVARTVGKVLGGAAGAWSARTAPGVRWIGVGLLPQAGVAIGMALAALEQQPDLGGRIVSIAVVSTVVFELVGPVATQVALRRAAGS